MKGTLPSALATLPWRVLGAVAGRQWPYCVVAFHRVWDGSVDELSYPPRAFAHLCRYWSDHVEVISLEQMLARQQSGRASPHPVLAITFDDGYADNAEIAAPILDGMKLPATFFVTSGAIGTQIRFPWDASLAIAPRMMNWDQVRELRRAGFAVGSHTVSHARLSQTRGGALEGELTDSRRTIEGQLGESVFDFAYPFGLPEDCDDTARKAIRRAGYRSCLSCFGGLIYPGDSAFELRRICVSPRYHATPGAWARTMARLRWKLTRVAAMGAVAH